MQYDGTVNGFPYFSQNDDRWNGIRYGGGNIGTSGCGPTAAAMIVKSYGFDVTPENTAKVFVNALGGYRTTEGPTCFSALQNSPYNLTVQQTRNINTVVFRLLPIHKDRVTSQNMVIMLFYVVLIITVIYL